MHANFDALRRIPIIRVAASLGLSIRKTGAGTYTMLEEGHQTSLILFENTNSFKRFSGKEQGGVSQGSSIDLVLHIRKCSLKQAIDFLTHRFL